LETDMKPYCFRLFCCYILGLHHAAISINISTLEQSGLQTL
jgi:hypothetical protein